MLGNCELQADDKEAIDGTCTAHNSLNLDVGATGPFHVGVGVVAVSRPESNAPATDEKENIVIEERPQSITIPSVPTDSEIHTNDRSGSHNEETNESSDSCKSTENSHNDDDRVCSEVEEDDSSDEYFPSEEESYEDYDDYDDDYENDYDEDYNEEDDDDDVCSCVHCIVNRQEDGLCESEEEHEDVDGDTDSSHQCAICFMKPVKGFVTLPCCGTSARESTSSTRFCKVCILKTLKAQDTWSPFWSEYYVGECPRCRHVINYDTDICRIGVATFSQAVKHAIHKEKIMRDILVTCAYANFAFLPIELLQNDEDKLRQLCSWGVLSMKSKGMYRIDPCRQMELRSQIELLVLQEEDSKDGLIVAAGDLFMAAVHTAMKFKLWTSIRLFNQAWTNCLILFFNFPELESPWQEFFTAGLNIFLCLMILQILIGVFIYGLICYASVRTVGWLILQPKGIGKYFEDHVSVNKGISLVTDFWSKARSPVATFLLSGMFIGVCTGAAMISVLTFSDRK